MTDPSRTYLITGIADDHSLATAVARRLVADGHQLVFTGLGLTDHHTELSDRARSFLERTYESFDEAVTRATPTRTSASPRPPSSAS